MRVVFILPVVLALGSSAQATELRPVHVRTGTDGLTAVELTVANKAGTPIACHADVAHWYSVELGKAAAGAVAKIELWFDPKTGTYATLNDKRDNLPVERLWCGLDGRAYATRSVIALDRRHGAVATARAIDCAEDKGRLACR